MSLKRNKPKTPSPNYQTANRPLQKLLSGLAVVFFGASMMMPFKDDSAGLSAVFTILGHPFEVVYWLFPICTLAFVRLIFRLHEIRIPILKAGGLAALMFTAVIYLYFFRNGIAVGAGVALWLSSGYILLAAAVRWRYPKGGITFAFTAIILAVWLTVWVQDIFKDGNSGHIWQASQQTDESMLPDAQTASAPAHLSTAQVPTASKLSDINASSLIAVERDANLYNPWSDSKNQDCETRIKRHFPVLLPPRFSEHGYEWRNYQHGEGVCNNLIYVGTRGLSQTPGYHYKITQDRRSNIYLLFSNNTGKSLFNEHFSITRESNGLQKSDYQNKLNAAFAKMVDAKGSENIDNEYVFTKAPQPEKADTLSSGCNWQPVKGQANTFQWGTGRINWRGQTLLRPQTFCSKNLVGVVHLAPPENGKNDNRLAVKLFRGDDLKPVECGAQALNVQSTDAQAWLNGQLQASSLTVTPGSNGSCFNITVKLNDERRLSSNIH